MSKISHKSQTFHNIRNEFISTPNITKEQKDNILRIEGITKEEYTDAFKDYKKSKKSGEDSRPFGSGILMGVDSAALRMAYGFIGDTGRGIAGISDIIAPETVQKIGKMYEDLMPDDAEKIMNELFDPYHGEGIITTGGDVSSADAEFLVRKLGAYLNAASWLKKGVTGSISVLGKNKNINPKDLVGPVKEKRFFEKLGKFTKDGAWIGGGATIIENPEESFVNHIYNSSEASRPILEHLYVNPNDPKALQYAKAAIGNIGTGAILDGALFSLGTSAVVAANAIKNTKPMESAITWTKQNMTAHRGLDVNNPSEKAIIDVSIKGENRKKQILLNAENDVKQLKKTAKEENLRKDVTFTPDTPEGLKKLNKALNDKLSPEFIELTQKYPKTAEVILAMRNNIEDMSGLVAKNLGNAKTSAVLTKNLETYLTRSYRIFDDPKYIKEANKALGRFGTKEQKKEGIDLLLSRAATVLKLKYGIADEHIPEALRTIIKYEGDAPLITQINKLSDDGGNVLSKLNLTDGQEDKAIRNLWGEYTTPDVNYIKTINKLAETTTQIKYLAEIDDILMKKGAYKSLPGEKLGKTAEDLQLEKVSLGQNISKLPQNQGQAYLDIGNLEKYANARIKARLGLDEKALKNPLAGIYVNNPFIAKAISDGFEIKQYSGGNSLVSKIWKTFLAGKALTQASKTAYNPSTHQVNIIGNQFMLANNGMLFSSYKESGKALKETWKSNFGSFDISKASDKELLNEFEYLIKNGVINSNVNLGMIRKTFEDIKAKGPDDFFEKILKSGDESISVNNATDAVMVAPKLISKSATVAYKTYQAEDDMFKIMFYRAAKKQYAEATGLTGKQLDMYAASLTRDLMPNYNLVPNFIKWLRRSPLGNFMAFPIEMLRTSKNVLKQGYEDYTGKTAIKLGITDPKKIEKLKMLGAKRLGSSIATNTAGGIAMSASAAIYGISSEEQDAIENKVAHYERGTDKIYLSGINRDNMGHMGVDYVNFGLIDPYQYPKAMFKNFYAVTEGAFDKDLSDKDYNKILTAAADQVLGPYFNTSIITDMALSIMGGEPRGVDPTEFQLKEIRKAFLPPDIDRQFFGKRIEYENSLKKQEELGRDLGKDPYGLSKSGYSITANDAKSWFGVRKKRLDLTANLRRDMQVIKNDKRDSGLRYNNILSEILLDNKENEDYIFSTYKEALEKDFEAQKNSHSILTDYAKLGITPSGTDFDGQNDFYKAMTRKDYAGFKEKELEDLSVSLSNIFKPTLNPFSEPNIGKATRSNSPLTTNFNLQKRIADFYFKNTGKRLKTK